MHQGTPHDLRNEQRDANSCLALGAGIGVVGTTSALVAGATCPLCFVLAPALLGVGAWKRYRLHRDSVRAAHHPQRAWPPDTSASAFEEQVAEDEHDARATGQGK